MSTGTRSDQRPAIAFDDSFAGLSRSALESMLAAGREVIEVHRVLAKTGDNVVSELLRDQGTFYEWDHYPKGDVYDQETHSQYYYHAHPEDQRFGEEHGHFHTFLRPKGMPAGIEPAPLPGVPQVKDHNDALSHLIAIAMTKGGVPFRLFTVNRWVTGEVWYRGSDVIAMLDRFAIDHARPSWPVNRWIGALLALFRPQAVALLEARDATVAAWENRNPGVDIYEDRALEVTSCLDISIDSQVRAVAKALQRPS
ncbi:MAG: DUF6969 family protein [Kiloniellales bacterium]